MQLVCIDWKLCAPDSAPPCSMRNWKWKSLKSLVKWTLSGARRNWNAWAWITSCQKSAANWPPCWKSCAHRWILGCAFGSKSPPTESWLSTRRQGECEEPESSELITKILVQQMWIQLWSATNVIDIDGDEPVNTLWHICRFVILKFWTRVWQYLQLYPKQLTTVWLDFDDCRLQSIKLSDNLHVHIHKIGYMYRFIWRLAVYKVSYMLLMQFKSKSNFKNLSTDMCSCWKFGTLWNINDDVNKKNYTIL